jgi:hypothetical protein
MPMEVKGNIFATLLGILVLSLISLYSLRFIFQYQIEQHAILVKLFGRIVLRRIPLNVIEEIKVMRAWSLEALNPRFYFVEKWPGWVFTNKVVFIKKREGLNRAVILYPRQPDKFVEQVLSLQHE